MAQASQLSPELARGLLQVARALLVAARNWTLYPPEHPTVAQSVTRLAAAIRASSLGAAFAIGVTPETLMIEGTLADASQGGIAEAAALLHDRDILAISFLGEIPPDAIHALLRVLTLDAAERRRRGGARAIWGEEGHQSVAIEQVDYGKMLAREERDVPEPGRRDNLWRLLLLSIVGAQTAGLVVRAPQRRAPTLALDRRPSDRAATTFNTIARDDHRKRRVMTLTRTLPSETDFARSGQFQVLWASTEELLVSYNDKPYVSDTYRAEL